jgi:hypothetical protein
VPLLNEFVLIKKSVNVTMSMWLCVDLEGFLVEGESGLVVSHSRDLLLLNDGNLVLVHAKVVIFL